MKISLEPPFCNHWAYGYLVTNPENRKNVLLYNSKEDRTTISYARYLVSVEIGSILEEGWEVDHIDEDKTNDSLDNLQILTKEQHLEKSRASSKISVILLKCPYCYTEFYRESRLVNDSSKFCTRKCQYSSSKDVTRSYKQNIIKERHYILTTEYRAHRSLLK